MNVVLYDQYNKGLTPAGLPKPMYIFQIMNASAAEKAAIDAYRTENNIKLNNSASGQPLIWVRKQYPNNSIVTVSAKGIFVDNSTQNNLNLAVENAASPEVKQRLADRVAQWEFDNIINVTKLNTGAAPVALVSAAPAVVAELEQIALGEE